MGLMDALNSSDVLTEDEANHKNLLDILKVLYFELDIYSEHPVYIWIDNKRIKFNLDGVNTFKIKKGTKFSTINPQFYGIEKFKIDFYKHLETCIKEFLKKKDIGAYKFYIKDDKIIFYVRF